MIVSGWMYELSMKQDDCAIPLRKIRQQGKIDGKTLNSGYLNLQWRFYNYIYIYTDVILNKKPNRKVFYQFAFAIFAIVNEILISKNCRVNG